MTDQYRATLYTFGPPTPEPHPSWYKLYPEGPPKVPLWHLGFGLKARIKRLVGGREMRRMYHAKEQLTVYVNQMWELLPEEEREHFEKHGEFRSGQRPRLLP